MYVIIYISNINWIDGTTCQIETILRYVRWSIAFAKYMLMSYDRRSNEKQNKDQWKKIEKSFWKSHVYAYTANMKCALIFRSPGFAHARKIAEFMANSI